jgi:hypothetical protein
MIQRIQTLYLVLAAVACALLFHSFFAMGKLADEAPVVLQAASGTTFSDGKFTIQDNLVITILAALGVLMAIITIFLYKKRKIQEQLVSAFILISLIINGLALFIMYNDLQTVQENIDTAFEVGVGTFLPALGFIAGFLALRGIRKDDKIVKSMDRLR